jgi:hypothetical protein
VKIGDLVRVKTGSGCFEEGEDLTCYWPESKGQIGVVIAKAMRLYVPAAKIMILGEVAEFDIDELEKVSA